VRHVCVYLIKIVGQSSPSHSRLRAGLTFLSIRQSRAYIACQELAYTFKDCEKKRKDKAGLICEVLKDNTIDLQNCREQGYDNGSNMTAIYNGVQALILEKILMLCIAHTVHIVLTYVESMQWNKV